MSSYISATNQEMLWKTIKKKELFNHLLSPEQQPIWFRDIIGNFYSENNNKTLNNTELLELNKSTLRYMIHNLKQMTGGSLQPNEESSIPFGEPISDRIEPRSESYKGKYEHLQSEYESMFKRVPPPEPEFKEKMDDGVIKNMDELIQQQIKEREFETAQVPKPPVQLEPVQLEPVQSLSPSRVERRESENMDIYELKKQIELLINRTEVLETELSSIKTRLPSVDVSGQSQTIIHQMSEI